MNDLNEAINDALGGGYLLLDVSLQRWTSKRVDRSASSELENDKHAVSSSARVVKNLLAGANAEYKAVASAQDAIRTFVYNNTLPWSTSAGRKTGARLLAAGKSFDFLKRFGVYHQAYESALADFLVAYDARRVEAMMNLGDLADPADYPDVDSIKSYFGVSLDMVPCPVVSDFSRLTLPAELANALGDRLARQQQAQVDNAMKDMGERITAELSRMTTQLGKFASGEKTRLFGSMITNMESLVDLLRNNNLTNSDKVTELADELDMLTVYNIDQIKNSTAVAKELAVQADHIAETIDDVFF